MLIVKFLIEKCLNFVTDTTLADKASLGLLVHCVLLTRKPSFFLDESQHGWFKGQTANPNPTCLFVWFFFLVKNDRRLVSSACSHPCFYSLSGCLLLLSNHFSVVFARCVDACRHQQMTRFTLGGKLLHTASRQQLSPCKGAALAY